MKTIVIGPGRIGCGCAGQLLRASGHEVSFVGRNPGLVGHLNRLGQYRVLLTDGSSGEEIVVDQVHALHAAKDSAVAHALAGADLIVTAVGAGNLGAIAPLLAAGLRRRQTPVNVLAFENLSDAGPRLRQLVARHLPRGCGLDAHGFSGVVVKRAVTQRQGDPAGDEPLLFVGDPPAEFAVSGPDLRVPLPPIEGLVVVDDLTAWMQRKLYIYSAGHATCAYLGFLKGYHYIHTAIRDPEIRAAVLAAMREGQRGLAARYGAEFAGDESELQQILKRFENAALQDTVSRVGRDPLRKLSAEDRLVGAAQLAQQAGVRPESLGLAAAAALCFDPHDPSAAELQQEIRRAGLGPALHHACGLDARRGLGRLVGHSWARLARGWQQDNVLLSLDRLLWAWQSPQRGVGPEAGGSGRWRKRSAKDDQRVGTNTAIEAGTRVGIQAATQARTPGRIPAPPDAAAQAAGRAEPGQQRRVWLDRRSG